MSDHARFLTKLAAVRTRIDAACAASGRAADSVTLLPVTKTHPFDVALFAREAGLLAVGENRVQEAADKRPHCPPNLRWELIGHLQSNKAKLAVETFARIQSLDSPKLAERLSRLSIEAGKVLPVLLQANSSADPAKFGTADFDALALLAERTAALPGLRLEGLMTIPALDADLTVARRAFETLREWRDKLEIRLGTCLPELSMGMSADLEEAIAAGSTLVRIGTALFGTR